jgi:1-deoxy-D-xylulose-5-phosphate reductoisomerase
VQYVDGSVLGQLGNPDMRTPIAHALAWPERMEAGVEHLDLFAVRHLDFRPPDPQRFPCLRLAYQAAQAGGTAPAILNAANEVAVAAFLERRIGFLDIAAVVEDTLNRLPARPTTGMVIADLLDVDRGARELAQHNLTH